MASGNSPRPNRLTCLEMDLPPLEDICLDEQTQRPEPIQERPNCFKNTIHEILFVLVCTLVGASFSFLQRSTVVIINDIKQELTMTQSQESWISASSGYAFFMLLQFHTNWFIPGRLTTGVFLLPLAFVVDKRRWWTCKTLLLASLTAYCLFVGLAAISMNGVYLDVMLAMAGVVCASHIPIAVSMLSMAYPSPSCRKNLVFAFFVAGGNPLAIIFGGVGSGLVTMKYTWRAAFCLLAGTFVVILVLAFLAVPPNLCLPGGEPPRGRDSGNASAGATARRR